jgi:hypothetical protein
VSRTAGSLVESDTVLAADGKGTIVLAWATIPKAPPTVQQQNQLAVSHDDGATFTMVTTPADAPSSASNDASLAYDSVTGIWTYLWEAYADDFKGAQHVFIATSKDGDTWSAAAPADAPADSASGAVLDFPWVAINPVSHAAYVSYEAAASNSNGSVRLVVRPAQGPVGADGGPVASVPLTDGARPNNYADLARTAFDASGSYYAAWVELGGNATELGGTISGDTSNAVYFTRADLDASREPKLLPANVKVSAPSDAVTFDGPALAVTPDARAVYVAYTVGTHDAVDVVVATSGDRGATWGTPVKVNDDAHCATHMHPAVVLDASQRLYVFWYDNRDGAGHFFYSVSTDQGATFSPNRLVSAPAFPFDSFQYSTGWLGDYYEPAFANGKLYVSWSDGRDADRSHAYFSAATVGP